MAKRINRSFADAFSIALEETEEWQSELNLRELIEEAFFSIEKAREKKATWEQITVILQKTIGKEIEIKADTVRQYYFDAVTKRADLVKKKKQKTAKNRTKTTALPEKSATTMAVNQELPTDSSVAETISFSEISEDSESSFNLRPRRKNEDG